MKDIESEGLPISRAAVMILIDDGICTEELPLSVYERVLEIIRVHQPDFRLK